MGGNEQKSLKIAFYYVEAPQAPQMGIKKYTL